MGALAVFAAGKDRLTAVYISLLTLGFSDFGQTHGYGQRVVIAQLVSGVVLLMGALPLLVSGMSIFRLELRQHEVTNPSRDQRRRRRR